MAEAVISLKLTPREFDQIREAVSVRQNEAGRLSRDRSNALTAEERRHALALSLELANLSDKLNK
jgi:hypothetical protein